ALDEVEQVFQTAVEKHEHARRIINLAIGERSGIERELRAVILDKDAAISDFLRQAPEVAALLAKHNALRAQVIEIEAALLVISSKNGITDQFWHSAYEGPLNLDLRDQWISALEHLEHNAVTALPTVAG